MMEDGNTLETLLIGIGILWFVLVGIYIYYIEPTLYRKDWYWSWKNKIYRIKKKFLCWER